MAWRRRRGAALDATVVDEIIGADVALASVLHPDARARLTEVTEAVVGLVHWEAIGGLTLTDEVRVTIAANAAIPVLSLDLLVYRLVRAVIVRPTIATMTGPRSGAVAGTLTDDPIYASGVTLGETGPIAISWDVAIDESRRPFFGRNLVIHEFAHKIDMSDGYSDGTPPMRGAALSRWTAIVAREFDAGFDTGHGDTGDDDASDHDTADRVLRSYAWANPAEFFAVATEAFFCTPGRLLVGKPAVYEALRDFYRQDPAHDRIGAQPGPAAASGGSATS